MILWLSLVVLLPMLLPRLGQASNPAALLCCVVGVAALIAAAGEPDGLAWQYAGMGLAVGGSVTIVRHLRKQRAL